MGCFYCFMRIGNKQHETELKKVISNLEKEGYNVVDLKGFSPDAIAVKNNKIVAVEVLGTSWRHHPKTTTLELHNSWTYRGKRNQYNMFDEVKIFTFVRPKKPF